MAHHYSLHLSLLLTLLTTTIDLSLISATEPPLSSPTTSVLPPPPPPPPMVAENQGNQLTNIIDALIGAGDYTGWANVLSSTNPLSLPLTATLFVPGNEAFQGSGDALNFDPFLIPYHIVPQRLSFSELVQFSTRTRLPSLLPSKYIVITNNSPSNFTINSSSRLTHPDIFVNGAFSVHGISRVLDYNVHDSEVVARAQPPPPPPPPETSESTPEMSEPSSQVKPRPRPSGPTKERRSPGFRGVMVSSGASSLSCFGVIWAMFWAFVVLLLILKIVWMVTFRRVRMHRSYKEKKLDV